MKKLLNLTMFDLLKGLAMIGVVFGHTFVGMEKTTTGLWFSKIIYSLLMPSFFMVSGYWLKKKDIRTGIKSAVSYLLRPFVIVAVLLNAIGFLHRFLQGNLEEWRRIFLMPSLLVSTKGENRLGAIWFIFALFLAWCFFYVIINIKNEKLQMGIVLLAGIAGGALMPLQLPYQLAQGLVGLFYVYCGYLLKKKKLLDAKTSPLIYIIMVVVWGVSVVFGSMNMYAYDVKYGIFSIVGSLCGAFVFIKITLYINLLDGFVLDGIRTIGRYSMWVLCVHAVEKEVIPWKVLFRFVEQGTALGNWTHFVVRSVLIGVVCMIMLKLQRMWISKRNGQST